MAGFLNLLMAQGPPHLLKAISYPSPYGPAACDNSSKSSNFTSRYGF